MLKLIPALLIILFVAAFFYGVYVVGSKLIRLAYEHYRTDNDQWEVEENSRNGFMVFTLEKYGQEPIEIGMVSASLPHWEHEEEISRLRIEAEDRVATLNRRLLG